MKFSPWKAAAILCALVSAAMWVKPAAGQEPPKKESVAEAARRAKAEREQKKAAEKQARTFDNDNLPAPKVGEAVNVVGQPAPAPSAVPGQGPAASAPSPEDAQAKDQDRREIAEQIKDAKAQLEEGIPTIPTPIFKATKRARLTWMTNRQASPPNSKLWTSFNKRSKTYKTNGRPSAELPRKRRLLRPRDRTNLEFTLLSRSRLANDSLRAAVFRPQRRSHRRRSPRTHAPTSPRLSRRSGSLISARGSAASPFCCSRSGPLLRSDWLRASRWLRCPSIRAVAG